MPAGGPRPGAGRPRKPGKLRGFKPPKPKPVGQPFELGLKNENYKSKPAAAKNSHLNPPAAKSNTTAKSEAYQTPPRSPEPQKVYLDNTKPILEDDLGDRFSLAGRRDPPRPSEPMMVPTRAKYTEPAGRIAWVPHQMGRPIGQVLFTRPHVNLGVLAGRVYSANELGEIVVFDEHDKIELMRVHGCRETR